MKKWIILCILMLCLPIYALPRFSANYEQNCFLCHSNPSGGGQRSSFGSKFFAIHELSIYSPKEVETEFSNYNPQIVPGLLIGADLRTIWFADDSLKYNSYLQMQGDLQVSFEPTTFFSIYYQQGLTGVFQVFAKSNFSFLKSYIKVGKFRPDYGWWTDDHTAFTRAPLRWRERYTDTGVEVGLHPERWFATFGIFNGTGNAATDDNPQKAYSASIRYRPKLGPFKIAIGTSYYSSSEPLLVFGGKRGNTSIFGPHFSFAFKNLGIQSEVDWKIERTTSEKKIGVYSSNAVYYTFTKGVTSVLTYDFIDPDQDKRTGSNTRYGVGMQIFPTPFVEISPSVRITEYSAANGKKSKVTSGIMMLHFFY
ncbi:MAG: hypothetical protein N2450_05505 [bacterium]|nr:hypothetical protein [bacterium]